MRNDAINPVTEPPCSWDSGQWQELAPTSLFKEPLLLSGISFAQLEFKAVFTLPRILF